MFLSWRNTKLYFFNQVHFPGNSGQVDHGYIVSRFQCLYSSNFPLVFPFHPFCPLVKLPKTTSIISSPTPKHSFGSKTIDTLSCICPSCSPIFLLWQLLRPEGWAPEAMFVQYDITSTNVFGIDTQILFRANSMMLVSSDHSNWDVNVWVVAWIALYHIQGAQKTLWWRGERMRQICREKLSWERLWHGRTWGSSPGKAQH